MSSSRAGSTLWRGTPRGAALFLIGLCACGSCAGSRSPIVAATKEDVCFAKGGCSRPADYFTSGDTVDWEAVEREVRVGNRVVIESLPRSARGSPAFLRIYRLARFEGMNVWAGVFPDRMHIWRPPRHLEVAATRRGLELIGRDVPQSSIVPLEFSEIDQLVLKRAVQAVRSDQIWPGFNLRGRPLVLVRTGGNAKIIVLNVPIAIVREVAGESVSGAVPPLRDLTDEFQLPAVAVGLSLEAPLRGQLAFVSRPHDGTPGPRELDRLSNSVGRPVLAVTYTADEDPQVWQEVLLHESFHVFFQWKPEAVQGDALIDSEPETWDNLKGHGLYACPGSRQAVEGWIREARTRRLLTAEFEELTTVLDAIMRGADSAEVRTLLQDYVWLRRKAMADGDLDTVRAGCIAYWERLEGTAEFVGLKGPTRSAGVGPEALTRVIQHLRRPDSLYFLWQGCAQTVVLDYIGQHGKVPGWQARLYNRFAPSELPYEILEEYALGKERP